MHVCVGVTRFVVGGPLYRLRVGDVRDVGKSECVRRRCGRGRWWSRWRPTHQRVATAETTLQKATTATYNVVMPVVSVRISDEKLHQRLKDAAASSDVAISTLAEQLIDVGLRMAVHPGVWFPEGPTGRRAALVGGPEVADVIGALVGGDVPASERRARTAELLAIPLRLVDTALAYYSEFTDEIDEQLRVRADMADRLEAAWHRQNELLAR